MFGILTPCAARTPEALLPRWMGHFCGLCLELRDDAGQAARLTANYDALALSVLVEAQRGPGTDGRDAGPCALRGMRRQRVATGDGPRLAATASLLLASTKLRDHIDDGDGIAGRPAVAGLAGRTADRCRAASLELGEAIGLAVEPIAAVVEAQREVEAACDTGTPIETVTAPTAAATGELFAHAAVLGGEPGNAEPFRAAGAAFGRLAHLLDAAEDFEQDAANGAWNPLAATGAGRKAAEPLARSAVNDMRAALEAASFVDTAMVRLLLEEYARHAVAKTFGATCATHRRPQHGSGHWNAEDSRSNDSRGHSTMPRGFWSGLCVGIGLCCTFQCCCRSEFEGPWSRRGREGCCHKCDCSCCQCCEGCNGCDC